MNLEQVYGAASREIRDELRAVDLLKFDNAQAEAIQRKVRRLTLVLDIAAQNWAEAELAASYARGAARARVALEILGRKPKRQVVSQILNIQDRVLQTLVEANISIRQTTDEFLEAALSASRTLRTAQVQEFNWREAIKRFRDWATEAVLTEVSRGTLGKQIFDYLLKFVNEQGFIRIKGKYWNPRKYAKLVARTEMRRAATEATKDLCHQYENDLVQISDHSTDCELCEEYEGNIYSISGHDAKYPMLDEWPPFHPNCKHSALPTSREAILARERFG